MLQLHLPDEFKNELSKTIQAVYADAIQLARKEAGVNRAYITIEEVCEIMKISRNTLNNWFADGLPKYKIGNKQYIKKKELNEFVSKHQI